MKVMSVSELIEKVKDVCKANDVKRLDLIESFATGNARPTSDIDYDAIRNDFLLEDIKKYGKQIY